MLVSIPQRNKFLRDTNPLLQLSRRAERSVSDVYRTIYSDTVTRAATVLGAASILLGSCRERHIVACINRAPAYRR